MIQIGRVEQFLLIGEQFRLKQIQILFGKQCVPSGEILDTLGLIGSGDYEVE